MDPLDALDAYGWTRHEHMTEPGPHQFGEPLPCYTWTSPDGTVEVTTSEGGPYAHVSVTVVTMGLAEARDTALALQAIAGPANCEPIPHADDDG